MNNLLSYCGLTDSRRRASEKGLPVKEKKTLVISDYCHISSNQIYSTCRVSYMLLELNSLEHFEISCWSTVSINEVYQILFEVCLSNTISSITIKSQNIPVDVDILGLCLDYLKNLKVLTLSQCFLTSGEEISNNIHTKNNLKKLKLEKCQIYEGHLEKLVNLFPFIEEFEMKNCNENHNLHYSSESLMTHLKIISGPSKPTCHPYQ